MVVDGGTVLDGGTTEVVEDGGTVVGNTVVVGADDDVVVVGSVVVVDGEVVVLMGARSEQPAKANERQPIPWRQHNPSQAPH